MADGWAVKVIMKTVGGGSSDQIYFAHVADRAAAEETVRVHISASPDVTIVGEKVVSHSSFEGMRIGEGKVGQWIGNY